MLDWQQHIPTRFYALFRLAKRAHWVFRMLCPIRGTCTRKGSEYGTPHRKLQNSLHYNIKKQPFPDKYRSTLNKFYIFGIGHD
jgi:hypothetical protein